jgi:hypothetical protein
MNDSSLAALAVLLLLSLIKTSFAEELPTNAIIQDAQGRELISGGYVAITEDGKGTIHYTPDDYRRMVRMGREAGLQNVFKLIVYGRSATAHGEVRRRDGSRAGRLHSLGHRFPASCHQKWIGAAPRLTMTISPLPAIQ